MTKAAILQKLKREIRAIKEITTHQTTCAILHEISDYAQTQITASLQKELRRNKVK